MTMLQFLPVLAYLGCGAAILVAATRTKAPFGSGWILAAVLGLAFLAFTAVTLAQEGVVQFWWNHTTSFAGNQVWFDLLLAVTISFVLLVPRAQAVGMRVLPWGIAVLLTASVALLPMLARVLWLEQKAGR